MTFCRNYFYNKLKSEEKVGCIHTIFVLKLKFIYSEKATKYCEIFPLLLTVCTVVKSGRFRKNFVAFSECMNFTMCLLVHYWLFCSFGPFICTLEVNIMFLKQQDYLDFFENLSNTNKITKQRKTSLFHHQLMTLL